MYWNGAGLIGGLGLVPGGNIEDEIAIFEVVHGSAPDIASKNLANPTALFQVAIWMLRYLDLDDKATLIIKALYRVFEKETHLTHDLNGDATPSGFFKRYHRRNLNEHMTFFSHACPFCVLVGG